MYPNIIIFHMCPNYVELYNTCIYINGACIVFTNWQKNGKKFNIFREFVESVYWLQRLKSTFYEFFFEQFTAFAEKFQYNAQKIIYFNNTIQILLLFI